ncbi:hypothetical protein CTAM01_15603, partial [Colletotrichum tamarilloi]
AASLADYFTCDCPPSRQLGLAFLVSPRYLPTLPSEIQRHLRPSQPVLRTRLIQEKNKREAGVGQQLQHLQSRPGHRIFPPHPVLPQVNYCRQPTVRPQLPQTADHRRCADRSLASSGATYTTHHHHQPRTAQRQPPPSPQLLLLLLLLPSHLSSPLSALILQLSQHHLAQTRLSLPLREVVRSSDQIEFNNPPGQIRGPLPLRILPACHFCTRSFAYARACHHNLEPTTPPPIPAPSVRGNLAPTPSKHPALSTSASTASLCTSRRKAATAHSVPSIVILSCPVHLLFFNIPNDIINFTYQYPSLDAYYR